MEARPYAGAALDAVVLTMLLIVVKPTPNLEIFFLSVLRNLARLARGPAELFFRDRAFFHLGAHPCPSALPPMGNARRVAGGFRSDFLR